MGGYPAATIQAAALGDRDAITSLLSAAQPDIRRYARRSCRTSSDVEDAVQETLFVLYRHLHGLRRVESFSSWLFVTVRRQCLRLARAIVPFAVEPEAAEGEARLTSLPAADLRVDLANAIQSLPPNYRDVVLLRDVEEMTVDEIATTLGATREGVKARLHRARALLREYLLR